MRQKAIAVGIIIGLAAGFAGCESPAGSGIATGAAVGDGGTGQVYVGFARSGGAARTVVPDDAELKTLTIKVTFTGPGGTIDKEFNWQGGTVNLAAGSWRLTANAYNAERLRAIAGETIQVKPGGSHNINMTACVGIRSEAELAAALGASGVSGIGHDTASGKGDLLALERDITLNGAITMSTVTPFTLVSGPGTRRTLTRGSAASVITVPAGASLTLGGDGELIIDNAGLPGGMFRKGGGTSPGTVSLGSLVFGRNASVVNAACSVANSGEWTTAIGAVNNSFPLPPTSGGYVIDTGTNSFSLPANPDLESGVDLTLKGGGTISLSGAGSMFALFSGVTLTLDGPTLRGNASNTDSLVLVENGGTFIMNDGAVSDNTAANAAAAGVNVYGGTFIMSGGTVSGNTNTSYFASMAGGVFVSNGTFIMSGGTISGNVSTSEGGGVFVQNDGTFTLNSPAARSDIYGNTPDQVYNNDGEMNGDAGETAGW